MEAQTQAKQHNLEQLRREKVENTLEQQRTLNKLLDKLAKKWQFKASFSSSVTSSPIPTHSGMSSYLYSSEEDMKQFDEEFEALARRYYPESDENADDKNVTFSEPVTAKESSSCANKFFKVGAAWNVWRIDVEDAHTHLLSLAEDKEASFFAVYDGHGGAKVAEYAGNNLHKKIASHTAYKKGDIVDAIKASFLEVDSDMLKDENMRDEFTGTTAVVVLIKNGKIYCGNVGDSRAVASVDGQVEELSYVYKPSNETETKRIVAACGCVKLNRVNAYPDVIVKDLTSDHEFLVLACDGIWDVMTNDEVVDFVRTRIAFKMEPEKICKEVVAHAIALHCQMGDLCCDNMTVVLVCFLQGETYVELAEKIILQRLMKEISLSSASDVDDDQILMKQRFFN